MRGRLGVNVQRPFTQPLILGPPPFSGRLKFDLPRSRKRRRIMMFMASDGLICVFDIRRPPCRKPIQQQQRFINYSSILCIHKLSEIIGIRSCKKSRPTWSTHKMLSIADNDANWIPNNNTKQAPWVLKHTSVGRRKTRLTCVFIKQ